MKDKEFLESVLPIRLDVQIDSTNLYHVGDEGLLSYGKGFGLVQPVRFCVDICNEDDEKMGSIFGYLISEYSDVAAAADTISSDMYAIAEEVCTFYKRKPSKIKKKYLCNEAIYPHIFIDTIVISEEYRGKGLGSLVIIPAIKAVGIEACMEEPSSVLLLAGAYEHRGEMSEEDISAADERLVKFYKKLGFSRANKTSRVMYIKKKDFCKIFGYDFAR